MMSAVQAGNWITLTGKTMHAKNRLEQNGHAWLVLEVDHDKMRVRSAQRTEGPRRKKRFDGRWVWLEDDNDFDWKQVMIRLMIGMALSITGAGFVEGSDSFAIGTSCMLAGVIIMIWSLFGMARKGQLLND